MALRRPLRTAISRLGTQQTGRWAARARRAVGVAALGSIALGVGALAPAAMADTAPSGTVGKLSYTSHYWPSFVSSPSAMADAWQSASRTAYWGYCNTGVTPVSADGLSNQAYCGTNSNIISHLVVPFTAATDGSWTFQFGPDAGNGSELLVDGVVVVGHWYDTWAGGNLDNTSASLSYTADLTAGAHTIEVYAAEPCCDGAWGARYQAVGASSWTPLQTSPPQVSVTGLPGSRTLEYGSADPGCLVTDAFDGTLSPAAMISATSGPRAADGLGARTATCSYTDSRGLTGSQSEQYTVVDTTAPAITGIPATRTAEATSASGASVAWDAPSATDAVDGTVPVTCTPAAGSTFAVGASTVTCAATDAEGNTSSASFAVEVEDTTAPALATPTTVAATATGSSTPVTFDAPVTATDLVDGAVVPACVDDRGTSLTPAGGSFRPGSTTVTCTATDAHGNAVSKSFTVDVTYGWSGLLAPVVDGGSYKLGRSIPVKFALTGYSAEVTDGAARLVLTKLAVTGSTKDATATSTANLGNAFRYGDGQYIYNLDTRPLSAGAWQLQVVLGDGVAHTTTIVLK
ncbi:CCXG family PEP-CTERM protein [Pedococcus sp. 2YAF34]|uniref:CCXG family PEP-CTERM protein n=1 Tax=Pedococcus sp. 2YAF34 TaxID=3233032 RepID=UPI003F968E8F